MPKPRALTPGEAKKSIANRLGPRVDRYRQFATKYGIRPYRVFLVHTKFAGEERGVGDETEISRVELLPSPKLISLDSVALSGQSAGMLPMGSVRLELVSVTYTLDTLKGRMIPNKNEDHIPDNVTFCYEIMEDGRGDAHPEVMRFRLAADPTRRAGQVDWAINLERIDTVEKT